MAITFTEEQERALNELGRFLDQPEPGQMCLQGFAGTGKTTILQEMIRRQAPKKNRRSNKDGDGIVLTAPTNKATHVLRSKNADAGLGTPSTTIHKLLGVRPSNDSEKRTLKLGASNSVSDYDHIIIDECSMLSDEMMALIQKTLSWHHVVYVGDPMQVPPVGETLSSSFGVKRKVILNTVMRQRSENPIIALTAELRDQIAKERADWSAFHDATGTDGTGIFSAKANLTGWMRDAFLGSDFEKDNDSFRYLAWTNRVVDGVNGWVRAEKYGATAPQYVAGERLLFKRPAFKTRNGFFNGRNEVTTVTLVNTDEEAVVLDTKRITFDPRAFFIEFFRWSANDASWMPDVPSWELKVKATFDDSEQDIVAPANEGKREVDFISGELKVRAKSDSRKWREFYAFQECFCEVQPCYALTVHRSQGSTFGTVFIDLADIKKNKDTVEMLKLLYVAASRPKSFLVV